MAFNTNPRLVWSANFPGGLPRVLNSSGVNEIAEASGQSFKKGEVVYNNSGIAVCSDDATSILGLVQEDAVGTGYATNYPPVVILGSGDLLDIGWTSSAGTETPVVGTAYGLDVTSNVWKLDYDETSTKQFRVVKILDTTAKRCLVTCIHHATYWQWFSA